MLKKINKGFTLIELLVVIAIIGLLSTLAVVALDSAREKSRDSKRVADIKQVQTALELYFNDNEGYPGTGSGTGGAPITLGDPARDVLCARDDGTACTDGTDCGFVGADTECVDPTPIIYMGQVPSDPISSGTLIYQYAGNTGAGNCAESCVSYAITFELEGTVAGLDGSSCTASPSGLVCI